MGRKQKQQAQPAVAVTSEPVKIEPADYFRHVAAGERLRATELEAQATVREARARYVASSQALCEKYGLDIRATYDRDDEACTMTRSAPGASPGG